MTDINKDIQLPEQSKAVKYTQKGLEVLSGIVPGVGGLISAAVGSWSDKEQEEINEFFKMWLVMLKDELKEKEITILEILSRLDMSDEKIKNRVKSDEYQSVLKKAFRDWGAAESDKKRVYIRNILVNSVESDLSNYNIVKMFLDWLKRYSEMHLVVVAEIYKGNGLTRRQIWENIGMELAREDSADADLFRLITKDLSLGGIIRQERQTDGYGNFLKKNNRARQKGSSSRIMKSSFDDKDIYVLTGLGEKFVHYAMNDITPKIDYKSGV